MILTSIEQEHNLDETCDKIFAGCLAHLQRTEQQSLWHKEMIRRLEKAFAPHNPVFMHKYFSREQYWQIALQLRDEFTHDFCNDVKAMLVNFGFHAEDVYWDGLVLRIVPPIAHYAAKADREHTPAHRDTWGVNIHSQMNWWSPVFPIDENRSIRFYPVHWSQPLANTTGSWSLKQYLKSRAETTLPQQASYPTMPQATCNPREPAEPVVIAAGDWLLFSSAHLHDSTPNHSDFTRFNVEFRTVSSRHLDQGKAAPNIDNKASSSMPGIFVRLTDAGQRLRI